MTKPEPRPLKNLPRWAQYEITNLRDEVSSLKDDLQVAACQKETKTYVASYDLDRKAQTFLPDDSRVRFEFGPHHIDLSRKEGRLAVHGSDFFTIEPHSCNLIFIIPRDIP